MEVEQIHLCRPFNTCATLSSSQVLCKGAAACVHIRMHILFPDFYPAGS